MIAHNDPSEIAAARAVSREDREIDKLARTPAANLAGAAMKAARLAQTLEGDFTDTTADPWERRLLRLSRSLRDDLRRMAKAAS